MHYCDICCPFWKEFSVFYYMYITSYVTTGNNCLFSSTHIKVRFVILYWRGKHTLSFLPTTYEVLGKVMFSHASVILFTGGGGIEGVSTQGSFLSVRCLPKGGVWADTPIPQLDEMATAAVGTHPIRMHSCSLNSPKASLYRSPSG